MATIVKRVLSESTDGQPINVSATVAVTIHTGPSSTADIDEVYLYYANCATAAYQVAVEYGASASQVVNVLVEPKPTGLLPLLPGFLVQGNSTPLEINVVVSSTDILQIAGYVNRITQ